MANDHVAPIFRDLLKGFVSDCVNGSSGELGHLLQRRITCLGHPGGPFVIQPGVEPVVKSECVLCRFVRQEAEAREHYRKSIAWQKKPAQTPEELERAGNPFDRLKGGRE